jgi:hypothetical protein
MKTLPLSMRVFALIDLSFSYSGDATFPIIQYADDTLLFLEACPRQLMLLKSLLSQQV